MGKENLETHSVGASPVPAAPYKAELSMKVGVQPLPQGCHRLTKRQSGVATLHFLPSRQPRAQTCHVCLVPERPILCPRWPTIALALWEASYRTLASLHTLSLLPCPTLKFSDTDTALHWTAQRCEGF